MLPKNSGGSSIHRTAQTTCVSVVPPPPIGNAVMLCWSIVSFRWERKPEPRSDWSPSHCRWDLGIFKSQFCGEHPPPEYSVAVSGLSQTITNQKCSLKTSQDVCPEFAFAIYWDKFQWFLTQATVRCYCWFAINIITIQTFIRR